MQLRVIVNRLNKRRSPVTDFTDKNIAGVVSRGFLFLASEDITNILGTWYKDRDGYYYWGAGIIIVSENIRSSGNQSQILQPGKAKIPLPEATPQDLPLSKARCLQTAEWLDGNYGEKCEAAVAGTPFTKELLYAIACKETAIYFLDWTKDHTPEEVLGRCVFDATGDVKGTRKAFPKNTAAFISRYGQTIANDLIAEANKTRAWRGFGPKQWVYAGYGIFQYDLQAITTDDTFFVEKQWYDIDHCIQRAMKELTTKWEAHPNDLFQTIKAYNGSGTKAENYANSVLQFLVWIRDEG